MRTNVRSVRYALMPCWAMSVQIAAVVLCLRPIRPSTNWRNDNFLGKDPASTKVKHRPVDPVAHAQFATEIKTIPPEKR